MYDNHFSCSAIFPVWMTITFHVLLYFLYEWQWFFYLVLSNCKLQWVFMFFQVYSSKDNMLLCSIKFPVWMTMISSLVFCQIFCMNEYKSHIALELQKPVIDQRKLQALSMISFAFVRNTFDDLDTPCWVTIVNFTALDVLGNDRSKWILFAVCLKLNEKEESFETNRFLTIKCFFIFKKLMHLREN